MDFGLSTGSNAMKSIDDGISKVHFSGSNQDFEIEFKIDHLLLVDQYLSFNVQEAYYTQ